MRRRLQRLRRPRAGEPATTDPGGAAEERFPSAWDDWHRRRRAAESCFVPWVEDVVPLGGRTVLEYGCGNGAVTAAFGPRAGRYIGVDIDAGAVADARKILHEGGLEPILVTASSADVLARTAEFRGEIDVFLCYAVLEHMDPAERLALLRLARDVVRPGGAIVVIETPNRLTPWDYHTSQLPFLNQLPEELALPYAERSPRDEFTEALRAATAAGPAAARETFTRWGRGMSYHEFELVFSDFARHVIASSWDPVLLPERDVHREELALQRVMDRARPDLPPAFSRYWLDLVIAAEPTAEPRRFLRPWQLRTDGRPGVAYTVDEALWMSGPEAVLDVALPTPTSRIVVGVEGAGDAEMLVRLHDVESSADLELPAPSTGAWASYADFVLPRPGGHFEVRLSRPGTLSLVLYEA